MGTLAHEDLGKGGRLKIKVCNSHSPKKEAESSLTLPF